MAACNVLPEAPMHLFALNATGELGAEVAQLLNVDLAAHEEREFEDGEHKSRPLVDVRGHACFVIQSLSAEPNHSGNDKLLRLLFFAAALRDHGATHVTAVVPYLAYGRKDRQTKPGDPVTTRYVAQLFEAMHVDALITLEAHNVAALQNAFRIPTLHLSGADLFAPLMAPLAGAEHTVVVSPDPGGVKRAQLFREALEAQCGRPVGAAYLEKRRSDSVVSGSLLAGDVRESTVLLIDDLISTGGTLRRAALTCRAHGARKVYALATHGLFTEGAHDALLDTVFDGVWVSNSAVAPHVGTALRTRIERVSAAPLLAQAIAQMR